MDKNCEHETTIVKLTKEFSKKKSFPTKQKLVKIVMLFFGMLL
jgi:hypothetical protein